MDQGRIESPLFAIAFSIPVGKYYKEIILNNPSILDSFIEEPVESIHWSVRVENVLKNNGLKSIRDLLSNFEKLSLCRYRNFGRTSFDEILKKISISLKGHIDSLAIKGNFDKTHSRSHKIADVTNGVLGLICRDRIWMLCETLRDERKLSKLLNTPVEFIDWSVRNSDAFKVANIRKIGDFSGICVEELMTMENVGKKSLTEVFTKLGNYIENFANEESGAKNFVRAVPSCDLEGLVKYILSKLTVRENKLICRRYGLWDGKREPLARVGKRFRLTRERIRQIQNRALRKLRNYRWREIVADSQDLGKQNDYLNIFMKEFFDIKLRPFMESNFGIANESELFEIIYSINGENIGFDLANEFLSEVFWAGKPIFHDFVIKFGEEVVGLNNSERELYSKVTKTAKYYLGQKGVPQTTSDLLLYFEKIGLSKDSGGGREKFERFLSVSDIPRDPTGKFGLRKWKYFSPRTVSSMAERALIEIGKPAHFTQIALLMDEMFPDSAPFNPHNVHARIESIGETFVWVAPGVYGLKRWGLNRPPYVKDYIIELLQVTDSPMHVRELTEKVLQKCNCSRSSVVMTLSLKKDVFREYPDKFYGLADWE